MPMMDSWSGPGALADRCSLAALAFAAVAFKDRNTGAPWIPLGYPQPAIAAGADSTAEIAAPSTATNIL